MDERFYPQLTILYSSYVNIKPLIAEIEVRYEKFPTPILNEIRAFNDHIARCYRNGISSENIEEELRKAEGHIERVALDSYKFLNVKLHKKVIRAFDRRTKGVNLYAINNGEFFGIYSEAKRFIETNLKEAKLLEAQDKEGALRLFEEVHNRYSFLEQLIIEHEGRICWARARFYGSKTGKFLAWLMAAIVSGVISSSIIPWDVILTNILVLFK